MSKLFVVGIGPGNYENMTIRADNALKMPKLSWAIPYMWTW